MNSAKDFFECATNECEKIQILYTPSEDVEANKPLLDQRFSRAQEMPGIQSYHVFKRADETHIYAKKTATSKETKIRVLQPLVRQRLRYNEVYSDTSESEYDWPTELQDSEDATLSSHIGDIEEGDWVVVIYNDWYPGNFVCFLF